MDTKETSVYFYLIIACILLGIIILYFILSMIKQQKRYQQLNTEKINAELNTLEVERKRIAADLHDDLGPVLSSAKRILQSLEDLPPETTALHDQAIQYIDSIIVRLRQIAKSLMPNTLLRKGLAFAVLEFIDFTQHKNLTISFQHGTLPAIAEDKRIQIYRILQEIIHNTIKHAKGKELTISLEQEGQSLVIKTADDGCGFDQKSVINQSTGINGGFGLQTIKSRVNILKGEIHIQSGPGLGTSFYISIPL